MVAPLGLLPYSSSLSFPLAYSPLHSVLGPVQSQPSSPPRHPPPPPRFWSRLRPVLSLSFSGRDSSRPAEGGGEGPWTPTRWPHVALKGGGGECGPRGPARTPALPSVPGLCLSLPSLLLSNLPVSAGQRLQMWSQGFQPPLPFPPDLEEAIGSPFSLQCKGTRK